MLLDVESIDDSDDDEQVEECEANEETPVGVIAEEPSTVSLAKIIVPSGRFNGTHHFLVDISLFTITNRNFHPKF